MNSTADCQAHTKKYVDSRANQITLEAFVAHQHASVRFKSSHVGVRVIRRINPVFSSNSTSKTHCSPRGVSTSSPRSLAVPMSLCRSGRFDMRSSVRGRRLQTSSSIAARPSTWCGRTSEGVRAIREWEREGDCASSEQTFEYEMMKRVGVRAWQAAPRSHGRHQA